MQEFYRNIQDSKINVKDSPVFDPNSRPPSHNSFSSFNPPLTLVVTLKCHFPSRTDIFSVTAVIVPYQEQ